MPSVSLIGILTLCVFAAYGEPLERLFPSGLPRSEWVEFRANGYSHPVCGVVYDCSTPAVCGMPLGGIDTGCIDLETSGLWGYCTLFNSHAPRRGPINLPFLGLHVADQTHVLCDPRGVKSYVDQFQGPVEPVSTDLKLEGVHFPKQIEYWGHYPVADLEYTMDPPLSVGLRAWAPFLPGQVEESITPVIAFEVHLRNHSESRQTGTLACGFPGPSTREAGGSQFARRIINEEVHGVEVTSPRAAYFLGVTGDVPVRIGGALGGNGAAWAQIAQGLPEPRSDQSGASVAVEFDLKPNESVLIQFLLSWNSPFFNSGGHPTSTIGRNFTHKYVEYYPDCIAAALAMVRNYGSLLRRTLAWQEVVFSDASLPIWLRESLVNNLHLFAETGLWMQALPPIPDWIKKDDGLYGMLDAPRHCPGIEPLPCSFYGHIPVVYFFPRLALSNLRGHKGYQFPDGEMSWVFGGPSQGPRVDFAWPFRESQVTLNGLCYAALVDQYALCWGNEDYYREFYESIKKNTAFTMDLAPDYEPGDRIISMPREEWHRPNTSTHWFEATDPGWFGIVPHVGGLHLAQLLIAERMAKRIGDLEFSERCRKWLEAGSSSLETKCWLGTHYLTCWRPETGEKLDLVFGYQLDGQWVADFGGLESPFFKNRVATTLDTIKRCNISLSKTGATNYAHPDGSPWHPSKGGYCYGTYGYFPPELLMLAMTYMYEGQREFGVELAHRCWENLVCTQRYTWDMPNVMRPDADTGERWLGHDYYQDLMLWSFPAAMAGEPVNGPVRTGGLVDRVLKVAASGD